MYFLFGLHFSLEGSVSSDVLDRCRLDSGVHPSFFGSSEFQPGFFYDSFDSYSRLGDGTLALLKGRIDSVEGHAPFDDHDWHSIAAVFWRGYSTSDARYFAKVYGDFCLIFFNPVTKVLLCVRDGLGVVPVYYHTSKTSIYVSTSQRALLALPELKARVNPTRLLIFLQGSEKNTEITCFEGIKRLPAGSLLTIGPQDIVNVSSYWSPHDLKGLDPVPVVDIVCELRRLLMLAVESRIKCCSKIGVELSGGLDSSTLFTLASFISEGNVMGYSAVFPEYPRCDESDQINAIHSFLGTKGRFFVGSELSLLEALDSTYAAFRGLHNAGNIHISWTIANEAKKDGCDILLNGVDGDNVFSHGRGRLLELSADGDWLRFTDEILAVADTFSLYMDDPVRTFALQFSSQTLSNAASDWRLFYLSRAFFWLNRKCQVPYKVLFKRFILGELKRSLRSFLKRAQDSTGSRTAWWGRYGRKLFAPDFLETVDFACFTKAEPKKSFPFSMSEFDFHADSIGSGFNQHYFEYMHAVSTTVGVPIVSPFMDRRLVEFCLRVPASEKLKDGYTRAHLRASMKGFLPAGVLSKKQKANLSDSSIHLFETQCLPALSAMLEQDRELISQVIDPSRIEVMLEQVRVFGENGDLRSKLVVLHRLWPIFCFSRWLKSIEATSVDLRS